jgi:hypothetical protein
VTDFVRTVKLLDAAGMVGGGSDENNADEEFSLEELRRQVAEMSMREDEEAELR